MALPFLTVRPNRIVSGDPLYLWEAAGGLAVAALLAAALVPLISGPALRGGLSVAGVALALFLVGREADARLAEAGDLARISLGGGFWLMVASFALAAAEGLSRLEPPPLLRLGLTALMAAAFGTALVSGWFDGLSIMQEYRANAGAFRSAFWGHLLLVGGSLLPALAIGLPLGRACFASPRWRRAAIPILNILQTTPSIAMFGLLMVPLAALVAAVPDLRRLGVAGVGATPALIALTLYSLLPIVTNTVAGFAAIPAQSREAGRAMGMTRRGLLIQVELPLAAPIILTGVRIVVVQNIGLAAIAALIGGGGFGTLIFRGMGQTAMDLVLLGTLPIVALAIVATIVLDAVIDLLKGRRR
ncbi:ABC transporter permease [Rhodobacteraceae bacterium MCCB 386]|nr:ABC transporter permease [Roseitranquillus sediminis]